MRTRSPPASSGAFEVLEYPAMLWSSMGRSVSIVMFMGHGGWSVVLALPELAAVIVSASSIRYSSTFLARGGGCMVVALPVFAAAVVLACSLRRSSWGDMFLRCGMWIVGSLSRRNPARRLRLVCESAFIVVGSCRRCLPCLSSVINHGVGVSVSRCRGARVVCGVWHCLCPRSWSSCERSSASLPQRGRRSWCGVRLVMWLLVVMRRVSCSPMLRRPVLAAVIVGVCIL